GLGCPGGGEGVHRVGLAAPAAVLAVGPVHLDDGDALGEEMTGQPSAVAAGSLDTDEVHLAEAAKPSEQRPVARWRGREAPNAELATDPVQGGDDMHIEMRVDAGVDEG